MFSRPSRNAIWLPSREIEAKSQRGKLGPTNRVKFQVIAFLVREERARVRTDAAIADPARAKSRW